MAKRGKPDAPKTPAEAKAAEEKARKLKARKEARAAKQAKFEKDFDASQKAHPELWKQFREFAENVKKLPVEEASTAAPIFMTVFRNTLRPGRKAKSVEKMRKRLARLEEQRKKLMAELGEPVDD